MFIHSPPMVKITTLLIKYPLMERFKKIQILYMGLISLTFFPLVTTATAPADFKGVISIIVDILTAVLPVIVLLAFIYFLWGLTQYLKADKENQPEAKSNMINGIIALFVMVSVWGFITILTNTFVPLAGTHTPQISDIISNDWSGTDIENPNP